MVGTGNGGVRKEVSISAEGSRDGNVRRRVVGVVKQAKKSGWKMVLSAREL
jgi:hypothetical protein